ncbi:hypothetical protein ABLE93_12645 [Xanthobacter sp. KR7-65]|uniref:hypothetical protein n=1 Tax=Xanthobacter sp. KR7-65 TaxID=3156612 RepID=UPI0032B4A994
MPRRSVKSARQMRCMKVLRGRQTRRFAAMTQKVRRRYWACRVKWGYDLRVDLLIGAKWYFRADVLVPVWPDHQRHPPAQFAAPQTPEHAWHHSCFLEFA